MNYVAVFVTCALVFVTRADDVNIICCEDEDLGCYSDAYPYDHLPLPTCDVGCVFELYTRQNDKDPVFLDKNSAIPVEFNPTRRTVFIIHGYLSDENMRWMRDMRERFLEVEDMNVIIVGWKEGADGLLWNYDKAAANTRVVAMWTSLVADNLKDNGGTSADLLWCVGHSLGAHVCGHVGMNTHVHRVTGLDPAGPEYEDYDIMAGVNPTSGDFVDIIHTDGDSLIYAYGQMRPLGHMDFYPNGGGTQPGCITYIDGENDDGNIQGDVVSCSHHRAIRYFQESIGNDCFISCKKCDDIEDMHKDCDICEGCAVMGYGAEGSGSDGIYYLKTSTGWFWSPFCDKC